MSSTLSSEPAINAKAAAKIIGAHERTVIRMAKAKRIPCYQVGKYWRFTASSLLAWRDEQLNLPRTSCPSEGKALLQ